jgi:hypothetical protein
VVNVNVVVVIEVQERVTTVNSLLQGKLILVSRSHEEGVEGRHSQRVIIAAAPPFHFRPTG